MGSFRLRRFVLIACFIFILTMTLNLVTHTPSPGVKYRVNEPFLINITTQDNSREPGGIKDDRNNNSDMVIVRNSSKSKKESELEDDSAIIHRYFWRTKHWLLGNRTLREMYELTPEAKADLRRILGRRFLWGKGRLPIPTESTIADADGDYEWRTVAQLTWQFLASELYPDLFSGDSDVSPIIPKQITKTKKIAVRDGLKWWNYKGKRDLECPGSFNRKCEMLDLQKPDQENEAYQAEKMDLAEKMELAENMDQGDKADQADAIITVRDNFHSHNFDDLPAKVSNIYFILESPLASPEVNLIRNNDYLAAYWRHSEIPAMYLTWAYYDPSVRRKKQRRNYANGKTKMAAIFVSNCHTTNNRLTFVDQLKAHMKVDVFGRCRPEGLECPRDKQSECFSMLKSQYRFYLSFENANCRDYISEKFFYNALQNDVIPVVLGGHRSDYKALAPEHSFIHVEDFETPEVLAKYLISLSKDAGAYNEYFEWKGTGEFIDSTFFCRVCAMLWYGEVETPPRRVQPLKWTSGTESRVGCLKDSQWYWERVGGQTRVK